jgi:hypothetical protein
MLNKFIIGVENSLIGKIILRNYFVACKLTPLVA